MVGMAAAAFLVSVGAPATATPPPDHKVAICHRTASETNRYVYIEVDIASLDAHFNNLPGHPPKDGFRDFYAIPGDRTSCDCLDGGDS
jgi:hypothetical protein